MAVPESPAPAPVDPDELRLNLQERLRKLQSMAVPESPAPAPVDPDELRLLNLQARLCKLQSELMPSEDPMAVFQLLIIKRFDLKQGRNDLMIQPREDQWSIPKMRQLNIPSLFLERQDQDILTK